MKTTNRAILIVCTFILTSCASSGQFKVTTPLYGEVRFDNEHVRKAVNSPNKVKVFHNKAPRGFFIDDTGEVRVTQNYNHKISGKVVVESNETVSFRDDDEKRKYSLKMLDLVRQRTYLLGGNLAIFCNIEYNRVNDDTYKPVATGYAVRFSRQRGKSRRVSSY